MFNPTVLSATMMIMLGCCFTVISFEMVVQRDPLAGPLFMLGQFLCVVLQAYFQSLKSINMRSIFQCDIPLRRIPLIVHLAMTLVFFFTSWSVNVAPSFGVSVPVTIVFRSSGVAANLLVGMLCFGKRFPAHKSLGALIVVAGAAVTAFADLYAKMGRIEEGADHSTPPSSCSLGLARCDSPLDDELFGMKLDVGSTVDWLKSEGFGMLLLCVSLLLGAVLGHWQEEVLLRSLHSLGEKEKSPAQIKKDVSLEMQLYSHLLSLPVLLYSEREFITKLASSAVSRTESQGETLSLIFWLIAGSVSQALCVSGVYKLLCETSSLTLSLVLSIRKVTSLFLSVFLFGNKFTFKHCLGSALVIAGAVIYSLRSPPRWLVALLPARGYRKKADMKML